MYLAIVKELSKECKVFVWFLQEGLKLKGGGSLVLLIGVTALLSQYM